MQSHMLDSAKCLLAAEMFALLIYRHYMSQRQNTLKCKEKINLNTGIRFGKM